MRKFSIICLSLLLTQVCWATIRNVPWPYPTIQGAITASVAGDTVRVAPGTYNENINYNGKNITVASHFMWTGDFNQIEETVIYGNTADPVVTFENRETRAARLVGFTVENGESGIRCEGELGYPVLPTISFCNITSNITTGDGGGLYSKYASPLLENCQITDNEAGDDGGGAYVQHCAGHPNYPSFVNCDISDNVCENDGGGVYTTDNEICFTNCVISGNSVGDDDTDYGGGIYFNSSAFSTYSWIKNCTFSDNDAAKGGGIYCSGADTHSYLYNCIFWQDFADPGEGPEIYLTGTPRITISWSDIKDRLTGGIHADPDQIIWEGTNLSSDPRFESAGDYHLLCASSPCKDAGNPVVGDNDPEHPCYPGTAKPSACGLVRDDMGAYGGPYADDWYEMKLHAAPLQLNFGVVNLGEDSIQSVMVYNFGTYLDLEICSWQSTNPVFAPELLDDSLVAPDDSSEIEITFTPMEEGEETGVITILTSDGSRTVTVRGEGHLSLVPIDSLTIMVDVEDEILILYWEPILDADSYTIYRSDDPFIFTPEDSLDSTTETFYEDEDGLSGDQWFYNVRAVIDLSR